LRRAPKDELECDAPNDLTQKALLLVL
jgi:hypothetical protein